MIESVPVEAFLRLSLLCQLLVEEGVEEMQNISGASICRAAGHFLQLFLNVSAQSSSVSRQRSQHESWNCQFALSSGHEATFACQL